MKTTPVVHVQTETRGDVPKFATRLAAAKVESLLRMAPEPVLFARVTLTMAADRAVARPAAGTLRPACGGPPGASVQAR